MIDKVGKELINEDPSGRNLVTYVSVNYNCDAPYPYCETLENKDKFHFTRGLYWVKYKITRTNLASVKPYIICCDLFVDRGDFFRVEGWEEFKKLGEKDQRIAFLLEFSTIVPEMFDLAYKNEYIPIPFTLDLIKYSQAVEKKYLAEKGTEIPHATLVDPVMILAEKERLEKLRQNAKIQDKIRRENRLR